MSSAAVEKAREIGRKLSSRPISIAARKAFYKEWMRRWSRRVSPTQTEEK